MRLRTLDWVLCLLLLLNARVYGLEVKSRELSLGLGDVPKCGLQCLFLAIPASECAFDDFACQCRDEALAERTSGCLISNCTMADSLATAKVQASICNLSNESRNHEVLLYTSIVYSISVIFVTLRVAGKVLSQRTSADDWVITAAVLLTAVPCSCVIAMTTMGFGEHLWNLEAGQLEDCLRYFYIAWSTYVIVLGLIKVSLVMFYIQIFQYPHFRTIAYCVLAYIVLSTLVIFLTTVFACMPVRLFWDRDIQGRCLDINALAYANSGNAIAHDIILLILPLLCIRKLQMVLYRKIAVGLMFSIGTFGCIATILRLHSLLTFKISIDPTWDFVPITIWTVIELGCGFVCVCLPSIRILLTMLLPKPCIEFLQSITNRSTRSRSTPTPFPMQGRDNERRKRSNWYHLTTNHENENETGYPGSVYLERSSKFEVSPRLESAASQWPRDTGSMKSLATDRSSEYRHQLEDVKAHRADCRRLCLSCGSASDVITALPRIGCLPDGGYSHEDFKLSNSRTAWSDTASYK